MDNVEKIRLLRRTLTDIVLRCQGVESGKDPEKAFGIFKQGILNEAVGTLKETE